MVLSKPAAEGGRRFSVVVAACKQSRGIGVNNGLPWRLRGDMHYFKQLTRSVRDPTMRNAVIMGRKTWESIPVKMRPLGDRLNVVISANPHAKAEYAISDDVIVASSLEDALRTLCQPEYLETIESVYVIGGASIYAEAVKMMTFCERVCLTEVSAPAVEGAAPLKEVNVTPAAAAPGVSGAAECGSSGADPFGCDTFFPALDESEWVTTRTSASKSEATSSAVAAAPQKGHVAPP